MQQSGNEKEKEKEWGRPGEMKMRTDQYIYKHHNISKPPSPGRVEVTSQLLSTIQSKRMPANTADSSLSQQEDLSILQRWIEEHVTHSGLEPAIS